MGIIAGALYSYGIQVGMLITRRHSCTLFGDGFLFIFGFCHNKDRVMLIRLEEQNETHICMYSARCRI